ncbi:hypothetical protein M3J09_004767 [Ascochyta lentis]
MYKPLSPPTAPRQHKHPVPQYTSLARTPQRWGSVAVAY